jgi:hypothetical protein
MLSEHIFVYYVSRDLMIKMWTNFAKQSNPTPSGGDLSFTWTNYMAQTPLYLEITEHPGTDSPSPGPTTWLRLLST